VKLVPISYVIDQVLSISDRPQTDYARVARTVRVALDDIGLQFHLPLATEMATLDAQLAAALPGNALDVSKVGLITATGAVEKVNLVENNLYFRVTENPDCTCEGYTEADPAPEATATAHRCDACAFHFYRGMTPIYGYTPRDTRKRATIDLVQGKVIFDATAGVSEGRKVVFEYTFEPKDNTDTYVLRRDAVGMVLAKATYLLSLHDDPGVARLHEAEYFKARRSFQNRASRDTVNDILTELRGAYSAAIPNV